MYPVHSFVEQRTSTQHRLPCCYPFERFIFSKTLLHFYDMAYEIEGAMIEVVVCQPLALLASPARILL